MFILKAGHWLPPRPPNGFSSNVPGISIPETIIKRLEGAQDQKAGGKRLCIDIINEVKEIAGVSGIHVMAYRQEEYVAEIVDESGVLKRPPAPGNVNCGATTGWLPIASNTLSTTTHRSRSKW